MSDYFNSDVVNWGLIPFPVVLGSISILVDNGDLLVLNNMTEEEGDEWTSWVNDPDFEFDEGTGPFEAFLGFNRSRIIGMEWCAYGSEELSIFQSERD